MSDTPRTDERVVSGPLEVNQDYRYMTDFARQLERELAEALQWKSIREAELATTEREADFYLSKAQPSPATAESASRCVVVPLDDIDIIGHREKGDEHKGRAWWSGGTWLRPGEVVVVMKDPTALQSER